MATEQDYRLQPRNDELSDVICNRCESKIGEVYDASQTPTGRATGRSETEITTEALQIVRDHLDKCPQRDQPPAAGETHLGTPPTKAPLKNRR